MLQPLAHIASFPIFGFVFIGVLKCLPILFSFAALPLLDWILGEEDAQELGVPSTQWTYGTIFYVFVALHITALLSTIYVSSLPGTTALQLLLLCLNQGVAGGYAINTAHELTHHSNRTHKFLGEALLTSCCYKHWPYSHRAHHSQVRSSCCCTNVVNALRRARALYFKSRPRTPEVSLSYAFASRIGMLMKHIVMISRKRGVMLAIVAMSHFW